MERIQKKSQRDITLEGIVMTPEDVHNYIVGLRHIPVSNERDVPVCDYVDVPGEPKLTELMNNILQAMCEWDSDVHDIVGEEYC